MARFLAGGFALGFRAYPSHSPRLLRQLEQAGLASSHLTWRFLHVMQPLRTFGVLIRVVLLTDRRASGP